MSGILQTLFLGAAAAVKDAYFNLVTLLLNTTATNGAQNNTFLDSSTNNFSITRNGNTTQGTFTPFSQTGWSTRFDGSSDGLFIPNSLLNGSWVNSNFTYEAWVYVDNTNANNFFWLYGQNNNGCLYMGSTISGATSRNVYYGAFNAGLDVVSANNVWQMNTWNHFAFVRNSTSGNTNAMKVFVNGSLVVTGNATTFNPSDNSILWNNQIGGWANLPGYCAGLRLTNRALYSSNFTPNRLTNIDGTLLLLCTGNTITDNSVNRYPLTINGAPKVQAFSPFAPAYITPTTYSNWFDGSGDYLSGASNSALVFGTGTYTIEMWINQTARSGTQFILGGGGGFQLAINSSGYIFGGVAGVGDFTAATIAVSLNTFTHIAIVRNSTSSGGVAYYVNGVAAGTATDSNNYTSNVTLNIATTNGNVGVTPLSGCLSNLRVLKGTALYTGAFTPPTSPLTNITNTSLLTCQNSTFVDNSSNALTLTATGNAQPVASPTPFAPTVETEAAAYSTTLVGGSGYFDGTGDYLAGTGNTTNSNVALTVEAWVYFTGSTASRSIFSNMSVSGGTSGVALATNPSGYIVFARGNGGAGTNVLSSTPTYVNTWYHFAAVRTSGGAITLFQNGAIVATGSDGASTDRTSFVIGGAYTDLAVNNPQGYIASLRVTTGAALYASAFAPSFAPFTTTVSSGTVTLLTNFTNAGIYDSTAKNDLETLGNAQVSTTQAKWGTTSMYFDGNGDYLTAYNNSLYKFGTGDFTIEAWIYPTYIGTYNNIFFTGDNSTGQANLRLNSGKVEFFANDSGAFTLTGATTLSINNWYHIAFCRNGSSNKIFINGVQDASATNSYSYSGSGLIQIGSWSANGGSYQYAGYIDDLRITRYARYTTNFTPPTTAFPIQ